MLRRSPARGTLIVLPRANVRALVAGKRHTPGADATVRNLNRNFRRVQASVETADAMAEAIWKAVERHEPQWLVDLHEGYAIHRKQPKSVGSSVIAATHTEARAAAAAMLARVNEDLPDEKDFVLLESPIAGSLARAFHEHFGRPALILETTFAQKRLPIRVRQHRQMVQRPHLDSQSQPCVG